MSELVTNAMRHAFQGTGGVITVEVLACDRSVGCRITDDGRGFPYVDPGRGGVIVAALARDLGGWVTRECCPNGSSFLLTFPRQADRFRTMTPGSS